MTQAQANEKKNRDSLFSELIRARESGNKRAESYILAKLQK